MKQRLLMPLLLFLSVLFFFASFFMNGKLPIPADTIIGLYHPFRDLYAKNYPNGIPYKNFLITDPVRQQYPWRALSVDVLKRGEMPLWNPYSFAGTPLMANIQSAVFSPFNLLLLILPLGIGWSIQVILQPLLFSLFTYWYLRNLKIDRYAAFFAGIGVAFSGFSVAWLEWNTVLHTALWLPLLFLSIDKLVAKNISPKRSYFTDEKLLWGIVFIFSLSFSLFSGHLQTFFYVFVFSFVYLLIRLIQQKSSVSLLFGIFLCYLFFVLFTAVQWVSSLTFILASARDIDLNWRVAGWFMPWWHLLQIFVPDFFGNPTTLNYWGVWNYAEFAGYTGVVPLVLALYASFFRRDKKTYFFTASVLVSLLFIVQNPIAELPFLWNVPFFSTAQPTRLLFVTDFSLLILAALGLDLFLKEKKRIIYPILFLIIFYGLIWFTVIVLGSDFFRTLPEHISTAKRNLYFPTAMLVCSSVLFILFQKIHIQKVQYFITILILLLSFFDLFRFFTKFTPFTDKAYLFPATKLLSFLQNQQGLFRIMETDSRILPPNFSTVYKLQSIDGYDPLYLRRYGELIAASERGEANINPPFGFNRIITPQNYSSRIIDLLGVKYVLSLQDISSPKLKRVFQEGQTRVYENTNALPRAFFVERTSYAKNKQEAISRMMDAAFNPSVEAIIEYEKGQGDPDLEQGWTVGEVKILRYTENLIIIEAEIPTIDPQAEGFLVFMDSFYPTWRAVLSSNGGTLETENIIYRTNYNFRGIVVPAGKHIVTFSNAFLHKLEL